MKHFRFFSFCGSALSAACRLSFVVVAGLVFATASSHAQRRVFLEDFEGIFPGTNWFVADLGNGESPAYWRDVDLTFFGSPPTHGSGSWAGYCAGVGYAGTSQFPDYQPDMLAVLQRTADLTGDTNATLRFWYTIPSIEQGVDECRLNVNGNVLWRASSAANWTQVTVDLTPFAGGPVTIIFQFYSDFSVEGEGCYLDDIELTANGGNGGGGGDKPNLTPHQPAGWSDKIVVSKVTGTTTDDTNLEGGDPLYLDWAVINDGSAEVTSAFSTRLYVDDVLRNTWNGGSLPQNFFSVVRDYDLGPLPAGTHTLRIVADSGNTVNESNENDNEYTKTIVIGGEPEIRIAPLALTFSVTNSGSSGFATTASVPETTEKEVAFGLSAEQKLQAAHEVAGLLDAGAGDVEVIVNLASPAGKPARHEWDSKARLQEWHRNVKGRQDEVLGLLEEGDFKLRRRYENLSAFSGRVTRRGLEKLARHPRVASVELSRQRHAHLAQGIPLMNAAVYRSSYNGSGVSIAIVDSGVDYRHPRLGGGGFPNAKVIGGRDFGDDDPDPIPDGNAHGTACAGIAAGDLGTTGDYIGGVAPNARIYALKISSGASGSASDADIVAAWDWCVSHKNDDPANPILVISTSFGGDRYTSACDGDQSIYFSAANNAVAAGITVLASSGNEGYCNALSSPACISSVISVGAVYDSAYGSTTTFCVENISCVSKSPDGSCESGWSHSEPPQADRVTGYSNTSGFLDLLAPSHRCDTTDIVGGGVNGGYGGGDYALGFGGTSAACPYAAGAVAALQSASRATQGRFLTPPEVRAILATTGDLIRDVKNTTITTPRVNLGRAIESLGQSRTFTIFNEGNAALNVTSIVAEVSAPWIGLTPPPPFSVPAGGAQIVAVSVNPALAPIGASTRRLLVTSDDADENPYPGGISITVTNFDTRPQLSGVLTPTRFILSWTTNSTGYLLQSSDALGTTWTPVVTLPVTIGALRYVTNNLIPQGSQRRFYRLHKP